jgi:SAM-dependent methyltransferase
MEADEYRKMAAVEDGMWYYRALHARIIRRFIKSGSAEPVLDAGCGTGGLLRRMEREGRVQHATGVDFSPLACELSRARTQARIVEADLVALPFANGEFGTVISADVLYHVPDDGAAFRELWRVMRPGGTLIVNVPAYRWLWSYHDEAVHSERRYNRGELREKLEAAGFELQSITHWNMFLLPLVVLRRKVLPAPKGGSDVEAYAPWLNTILGGVLRLEEELLNFCKNLPAGSSLLAVAKKPTQI